MIIDPASLDGQDFVFTGYGLVKPGVSAEMMQADLAKVGINAKLVTYEWGEYIKRAKDGEHDSMLIGWSSDLTQAERQMWADRRLVVLSHLDLLENEFQI